MTHCKAKCKKDLVVCVHVCVRPERCDVITLGCASWRGQISRPVVQKTRLPLYMCDFL